MAALKPVKMNVLLQVEGSDVQNVIGTIEVDITVVKENADKPNVLSTDGRALRSKLVDMVIQMERADWGQEEEG